LGDHVSALATFALAIERGNVVAAELAARDLGNLRLVDALELTALIAQKNRLRSRRMAARWLERWLTETPGPTIDDAVMVAGCLAALGGASHENAVLVAPRDPRGRDPASTCRACLSSSRSG
jgi:hypothetical protein